MACSRLFIAFLLIPALAGRVYAQNDTTKRQGIDSFLLKQKGIIGQLAGNLLADSAEPVTMHGVQRTDEPFQPFRGRIIRRIIILGLDFGVPIGDTSKRTSNRLTRLANNFHHKTRNYVIRDNLFFEENQKLSPYLMGDNERHLRDLPYLQDARITVRAVRGSKDSVDVFIYTKDVLSIGGGVRMHNTKSASLTVKEDNAFGWGDRIQVQTLYDYDRKYPFGFGVEYIKRNISKSFIDAHIGYQNFKKSYSSGNEEESVVYLRFLRPLVNQYMRWTYSVETALHSTKNMYVNDSLYNFDFRYKYKILDGWIGWNMSADKIAGRNEDDRLRRLLSVRIIEQAFSEKPQKYHEQYFYQYADLTAVLASASIFKQNFYKTQYIYGFGRNEDLPEGIDISLTGGWTRKNNRERPYVGLDFQRYYFTNNETYFSYTARIGSFFHSGKPEDADVLANIDYFSRLYGIKSRWKKRIFASAGFGRQFHSLLNEPLMLESEFGLPGFRNKNIGGDLRITAKAETVFFSPWSILLFRIAPFVFGNASLFHFYEDMTMTKMQKKLYSSIGGGIRTRNESLIFGTIEFKGYYFPQKNLNNEYWRIEVNTNIRFKYNRQFLKRPEFVRVN